MIPLTPSAQPSHYLEQLLAVGGIWFPIISLETSLCKPTIR